MSGGDFQSPAGIDQADRDWMSRPRPLFPGNWRMVGPVPWRDALRAASDCLRPVFAALGRDRPEIAATWLPEAVAAATQTIPLPNPPAPV
jgi:hypothetical protein